MSIFTNVTKDENDINRLYYEFNISLELNKLKRDADFIGKFINSAVLNEASIKNNGFSKFIDKAIKVLISFKNILIKEFKKILNIIAHNITPSKDIINEKEYFYNISKSVKVKNLVKYDYNNILKDITINDTILLISDIEDIKDVYSNRDEDRYKDLLDKSKNINDKDFIGKIIGSIIGDTSNRIYNKSLLNDELLDMKYELKYKQTFSEEEVSPEFIKNLYDAYVKYSDKGIIDKIHLDVDRCINKIDNIISEYINLKLMWKKYIDNDSNTYYENDDVRVYDIDDTVEMFIKTTSNYIKYFESIIDVFSIILKTNIENIKEFNMVNSGILYQILMKRGEL